MSTLGFGDITFTSDVGRLFSIVVLMSGIILLMIMLPFAFIRYFYAPWLEAQLKLSAPREAPHHLKRHLVICKYDSIAPGLIRKLKANAIPYIVLEPDPVAAAHLLNEGVYVVTGDVDNRHTYEALHVSDARLVLVNLEDTVNSNVTLTVREVDSGVPIAALVENEDSIDILELSGATAVLPLKQRLGEYLANRVNAGAGRAHVVGQFKDLLIAEFPARNTPLEGLTIRETELRSRVGASIAGVWVRGKLLPATADQRLDAASVPVVVGTEEQIDRLNRMFDASPQSERLVLVIGGGKVGIAAARALKRNGHTVHMVECDASLEATISEAVDEVVIGDAADRDALMRAGLAEASSVILTTNQDAVNVYLSIYCRRLNPDLRIVSRITHERNFEAIHRAGADFVLSYAALGVESVFSQLVGREPVVLGGAVDYYLIEVPPALEGRTLAESRIGSRTGLVVIAVKNGAETITNPPPHLQLPHAGKLLVLGTPDQREALREAFA
jgi:Trk K+ transport system NAD-binding subunit